MFEFLDFKRMYLNIKWVFLTQDSIQDCIRKWQCDCYCNLYNQSDETEKEAHDHHKSRKVYEWYLKVWVFWYTKAHVKRDHDDQWYSQRCLEHQTLCDMFCHDLILLYQRFSTDLIFSIIFRLLICSLHILK